MHKIAENELYSPIPVESPPAEVGGFDSRVLEEARAKALVKKALIKKIQGRDIGAITV